MSIVYLIREPALHRDIRIAENFGEVHCCLKSDESQLGVGMIMNRLRSTLKNFKEGEDYILWAGGEWQIVLALGVVMKEYNFRTVDLLVWKKTSGVGSYVPQRLVL